MQQPTYQETLDYLFNRLPMFQNVGKSAYKADLNNTIDLLNAIGNPQDKMTFIHVGGTNGKGSVSSMLASIFTQHGYKTGLYTSPHLVDFRERIRINGQEISEAFVIDFTQRIKPHIETIHPSFFEITVAMAFDYFAKEKIDIGIIEVGLGGRLDSTNVIHPILSVITNVSWDHMDLLGDTLEKIALEKAGIIKQNVPVAIGEMEAAPLQVIIDKAKEMQAPYNNDWTCEPDWIDACELKGIYQRENLNTVYRAIKFLESTYRFDSDKIMHALSQVNKNTGLRGRWEILKTSPLVIADTAHNYPGVKMVMQQLMETVGSMKLHIVWGMVGDKDRKEILKLLPTTAAYYFTKPSVIRGLDATILQEDASGYHLKGNTFETVGKALEYLLENCDADDIIYVGGSTFIVADAISFFEH